MQLILKDIEKIEKDYKEYFSKVHERVKRSNKIIKEIFVNINGGNSNE